MNSLKLICFLLVIGSLTANLKINSEDRNLFLYSKLIKSLQQQNNWVNQTNSSRNLSNSSNSSRKQIYWTNSSNDWNNWTNSSNNWNNWTNSSNNWNNWTNSSNDWNNWTNSSNWTNQSNSSNNSNGSNGSDWRAQVRQQILYNYGYIYLGNLNARVYGYLLQNYAYGYSQGYSLIIEQLSYIYDPWRGFVVDPQALNNVADIIDIVYRYSTLQELNITINSYSGFYYDSSRLFQQIEHSYNLQKLTINFTQNYIDDSISFNLGKSIYSLSNLNALSLSTSNNNISDYETFQLFQSFQNNRNLTSLSLDLGYQQNQHNRSLLALSENIKQYPLQRLSISNPSYYGSNQYVRKPFFEAASEIPTLTELKIVV